MARNAAYRWQNERKRGLLGKGPKPTKRQPRHKRGITNKQAGYLAAMQRKLGERYRGTGMTASEASRAIDAAKRRLNDATPARAGATRESLSTKGKPSG